MKMYSILKRLSLTIIGFAIALSSLMFITAPAFAETHTVLMGGNGGQLAFEPKTITIKPGDTIKWINNKAFPHNIVVDGKADLSHKKLLQKPKQEVETTFNEPGEYNYYCEPHRGAGMTGKVIVAG